MSQELNIALICGGLICLEERKRRRVWVKDWLKKRQRYSHMNLLRDLSVHEPVDLFNFLRMNKCAFEGLLKKVNPLIKKKDTVMRYAVSPRERLTITLRYLATGNSLNLKFLSAISPQLLGKIIPETCWAIFNTMKQEFLKVNVTFIKLKSVIIVCKNSFIIKFWVCDKILINISRTKYNLRRRRMNYL